MKPLRVALCGNIGVGKSTICDMLAKALRGKVVQENFAENPYLEPYYDELKKGMKPNKYAIGSQLFFLKETFDTHQVTSKDTTQIFDRSLHENVYVFAESLISMGLMSEIDAKLYRRIASDYIKRFVGYDVFIYLKTNEKILLERIHQRGREMEKSSIDVEYLAQLNRLYEAMFDNLSKKEGEKVILLDNTELSEEKTLAEILKQLKEKSVITV